MNRHLGALIPLAAVLLAGSACGPGEISSSSDAGGADAGGADGSSADGDAGEDPRPQPGVDTDGDGLDDDWEYDAGDEELLDWRLRDSDGDGVDDGLEDYDGDGLTNLEEFAAARLTAHDPRRRPHPLRRDLLVELDAMEGRAPPETNLFEVAQAFADLRLSNIDGSSGVLVHFYADELDIPAREFDGSFEERNSFLRSHGPQLDDQQTPPLPLNKLIHLVAAARRKDLPDRGGEVVADSSGDVEGAGVFLYRDVIYEMFPMCARPLEPVLPAITPEEMITATLVHELGHTLQLGHDTEAGSGINYFNIMSVPGSCPEAHMRVHGTGNHDPDRGNTESLSAPRFSRDAAQLMRFGSKLSVDTATMEDQDGYEM